MKIYKDYRGFTLIEVLLVIAITGIVISFLPGINIAGFQVWNFNQERVEIQRLNRLILNRIASHTRVASEINQTNFPDELRISFFPRNEGDDVYTGMIYGLSDNGEFYYRRVYEDDSLGEKIFITSSEEIFIDELSFSYHSEKKIVEIKLRLITDSFDGYTMTDRIHLRNTDVVITSS